jgi:hypothetical protein
MNRRRLASGSCRGVRSRTIAIAGCERFRRRAANARCGRIPSVSSSERLTLAPPGEAIAASSCTQLPRLARGHPRGTWHRRGLTIAHWPPGGHGLIDEQGDQVVASSSTGRRLPVEDDHGASGARRYRAARFAWRAASAARRPLTGRACPDGRSGGEGVRSAMRWTTKRRSTPRAVRGPRRPRRT